MQFINNLTKKNKILIFGGVLILFVLIYFIVGSLSESDQESASPYVNRLEDSINNNAVADNVKPQTYKIEALLDNQNSQIFEYPDSDAYHILVVGSPFEEARLQAEQDFLATTGLTEQQACLEEVVINTPAFANPNEAGENFPLSFCDTSSYLDDLDPFVKGETESLDPLF